MDYEKMIDDDVRNSQGRLCRQQTARCLITASVTEECVIFLEGGFTGV